MISSSPTIAEKNGVKNLNKNGEVWRGFKFPVNLAMVFRLPLAFFLSVSTRPVGSSATDGRRLQGFNEMQ